jgi:uncharacterized protein (TIGR02300 family)
MFTHPYKTLDAKLCRRKNYSAPANNPFTRAVIAQRQNAQGKGFDKAALLWHRADSLQADERELTMPKQEWGVKRMCPFCGTRFYDLNRAQMTCPNCGKSFDLAALEAPRGKAARVERVQRETADADDLLLADADEDPMAEDAAGMDLDDEILEEEEDDNVRLDDLTDVPAGDEDS